MAQKDLKQQARDGDKATLLYEALVMEGEYLGPGYLAVHRIEDKQSGFEVGVFTWHKGEDSYGSQFAPNPAYAVKNRKK
jgi:hypothetical protein